MSLQQPIPILKTNQNIINVIVQDLNLQLKTLNASNSKLLFCDLVIFSSKPFNFGLLYSSYGDCKNTLNKKNNVIL